MHRIRGVIDHPITGGYVKFILSQSEFFTKKESPSPCRTERLYRTTNADEQGMMPQVWPPDAPHHGRD